MGPHHDHSRCQDKSHRIEILRLRDGSIDFGTYRAIAQQNRRSAIEAFWSAAASIIPYWTRGWSMTAQTPCR